MLKLLGKALGLKSNRGKMTDIKPW